MAKSIGEALDSIKGKSITNCSLSIVNRSLEISVETGECLSMQGENTHIIAKVILSNSDNIKDTKYLTPDINDLEELNQDLNILVGAKVTEDEANPTRDKMMDFFKDPMSMMEEPETLYQTYGTMTLSGYFNENGYEHEGVTYSKFRLSIETIDGAKDNENDAGFKVVEFAKTETESSSCFVATATFGDYNSPEVRIFRLWRDDYLMKSKSGRLFISIYYLLSPILAKQISRSNRLKRFFRRILNYLIERLGG